MGFSDSEWIQRQRIEVQRQRIQFSDSELDLANIETNGRPYDHITFLQWAMCDAEKDWHERSFGTSGAINGCQNLLSTKWK